MTTFLRAASQGVDLVILDLGMVDGWGGPVFGGPEQCPVNAAIVVRDMRHTSSQQTEATAARLRRSGIEAVGVAENYVPPQAQKAAA
jgi:Mrp family chromosome partitioning ATPase